MREFQGLSFANIVRKQADQKTNFGIGTVRRCFSQSKYNLCYIPVHVQSFFGKTFSAQGGGAEVILHPLCQIPYNPNTIDIIKIQSYNPNTIIQSK